MSYIKSAFVFAVTLSLGISMGKAYALGDQWYIGIGGTGAWLQPDPEQPGLNVDEEQGTGGTIFIGRDFDDRSSGQLQLYSLGEAVLDNDEVVPFYAFDGSVVYRLYDSRDARLSREGIALALYGRFALGYMQRDTDVPLSNDAAVYFGAGGGAEVFFTDNLSMRLEGMYHDRDAASGSIQLVARFGGAPRFQPRPLPELPADPQPTPSAPATTGSSELPDASSNVDTVPAPSVPVPQVSEPAIQTPVTPSLPTPSDFDADGVPDAQDQCPSSAAGFPVRPTGCSLLDGVLSGVSFVDGTADLLPGATNQLDYLANVLKQYPQARVELHAHTDDRGTVRDQAILTRARLKTIGTYLVRQGVSARRLVLRSFGGTRPLYDNVDAVGRQGNNRIEVLEHNP